jgi:hypothetical protein
MFLSDVQDGMASRLRTTGPVIRRPLGLEPLAQDRDGPWVLRQRFDEERLWHGARATTLDTHVAEGSAEGGRDARRPSRPPRAATPLARTPMIGRA